MTNEPKHIGIVGCSAEGAALCYRTICVEGSAMLGRHAHPEVSMHTYPLSQYMQHVDAGDWQAVGDLMAASAEKLFAAGADFFICPDNTIHQAFDHARNRSPRPWLNIAEEVALVAEERGLRKLGVLGTRYLMQGPVYPQRLRHHGIGHEVPNEAACSRINAVIFDELVYGRIEEASRRYFQGVIRKLEKRGCDGVVLGCTEIPLLISDSDSPLPTLDSTRILARAALSRAVA